MSFGNFTTFHSCNLDKILSSNSSWLAHSSSVMKTCNIKRLYAKRGKRYFGKSKLNLIDLVEHSLRVNAVFFQNHFIKSPVFVYDYDFINIGRFKFKNFDISFYSCF